MIKEFDRKTRYLKLLRFKKITQHLSTREEIVLKRLSLKRRYQTWKNIIRQDKILLMDERRRLQENNVKYDKRYD